MVHNNDLPDDVRAQYRLTAPLNGGPVFDFPAYSLYRICFSRALPPGSRRARIISPAIAARLVRAGWRGLEALPQSAAEPEKAPTPRRLRTEPPDTLPSVADTQEGD